LEYRTTTPLALGIASLGTLPGAARTRTGSLNAKRVVDRIEDKLILFIDPTASTG